MVVKKEAEIADHEKRLAELSAPELQPVLMAATEDINRLWTALDLLRLKLMAMERGSRKLASL